MRLIRITYEIVTPESAENGEADEQGWIDEEGREITPDEYDLDDSEGDELQAVVKLAVKEIGYCVEPSSTRWHTGVWYSEIDGATDYRTGANTRNSYHLSGFSQEEELAIFAAITRKRSAHA